jgi:hypothetical protein
MLNIQHLALAGGRSQPSGDGAVLHWRQKIDVHPLACERIEAIFEAEIEPAFNRNYPQSRSHRNGGHVDAIVNIRKCRQPLPYAGPERETAEMPQLLSYLGQAYPPLPFFHDVRPIGNAVFQDRRQPAVRLAACFRHQCNEFSQPGSMQHVHDLGHSSGPPREEPCKDQHCAVVGRPIDPQALLGMKPVVADDAREKLFMAMFGALAPECTEDQIDQADQRRPGYATDPWQAACPGTFHGQQPRLHFATRIRRKRSARSIELAPAPVASTNGDMAAYAKSRQAQRRTATRASGVKNYLVFQADRSPAYHPFGADVRVIIGCQALTAHCQWPRLYYSSALVKEALHAKPFVPFIGANFRPVHQRHCPYAFHRKAALIGNSGKLVDARPSPPIGAAIAVDGEGATCRFGRCQFEAIAQSDDPRVEGLALLWPNENRQPCQSRRRYARLSRVKVRSRHDDDRRAV